MPYDSPILRLSVRQHHAIRNPPRSGCLWWRTAGEPPRLTIVIISEAGGDFKDTLWARAARSRLPFYDAATATITSPLRSAKSITAG